MGLNIHSCSPKRINSLTFLSMETVKVNFSKGMIMEQSTKTLVDEINELKSEVKMLRAIVQSLMYVITEDQDIDTDMELIGDEKDQYYGRLPSRNYVS